MGCKNKNFFVNTIKSITCFPTGVEDKYSTEGWLFMTSINRNFCGTTSSLQHQSGERSRECVSIWSCKIKLKDEIEQEAIF